MIYFLPWGGNDLASSRLRVYNVIPHLKDALLGTPPEYQKGDILIIQKAINVAELLKAQKEGAKVLYDIDDNYLDKPDFAEMCRRADLVTVGSSYFHKWFPDSPVIDDSLDWDGTIKTDYTETKKACWYAYGNTNYLQAFGHALVEKGYTIRAIVGERYMPYYKEYDVQEWNLETVDKLIAETDFATMYLPEDDFSQAKGMNKLIKAWAIGVPAFVSYMPEYDRVMRESGMRGFVVTDWFNHDYAKKWVPEMREYALQFSPQKIARQWEDAITLV